MDLRALAFRRPPPLPVVPPVGPQPQEGDWSGALEVARRGYEAVLNDDFSLAVSTLDAGYSSWARSAERDLANIMGVELGVQGARSKSPQ
eukprot:8024958-Pyramimonas_sp.AAC.1